MAKLGVILMVIKDKVQELGVYEAMRQYAEIGFKSAEISQIPMTPENVAEFKRAMDDFGFTVDSMTASLEPMKLPGGAPMRPGGMLPPGKDGKLPPIRKMENLQDDYDKIVADCKTLGCHYLRIGMLPMQYAASKELLIEFAKKADAMAEKLEADGISLYYHNHHLEFAKYDGKTALEIIRDNSTKLGFEIDVHWCWRGGHDPVKVIKEFGSRAKLIHLKDYRIGQIDPSKGFAAMADIVQFAEIGEGSLDFPAIINTAKETGAEFFFIEQDNTYGRDPYDSLRISAENIKKMGFTDLF